MQSADNIFYFVSGQQVTLTAPKPPEMWITPINGALDVIPSVPGIYFVCQCDDRRPCYIGQSTNLRRRLNSAQHHIIKDVHQPKVAWLPCPIDQLNRAEAFYIAMFDPALNFGGRKHARQRKVRGNVYDQPEQNDDDLVRYDQPKEDAVIYDHQTGGDSTG